MGTPIHRLAFLVRSLGALGAFVLLAGGCSSGGTDAETEGATDTQPDPVSLRFAGSSTAPDLTLSTGWVPESGPASFRAEVAVVGEASVDAEAVYADALEPVVGSGSLSSSTLVSLSLEARFDAAGLAYEGEVESFEYSIEPATEIFDPFSLGEAVTLTQTLPPAELGRVPVPSVPGAEVLLEITGGSLVTQFEGVCAEVLDGAAQYTGALDVSGTVEVDATLELSVPLVGTETYGPFALDAEIPSTRRFVDLGTLDVTTGDDSGLDVCGAEPGTTSGAGSEGGATGGAADETGTDGCSGCIDTDGACRDGVEDEACGVFGEACRACGDGEVCAEGECAAPPACGPDNCDGCCVGDRCFSGEQASACGAGGLQCEQCQDSACENGSCAPPCSLVCDGCCAANGACIEPQEQPNSSCGLGGAACSSCEGGDVCAQGSCISQACQDTCDGCCDGDTCLAPGTSESACGLFGLACVECGTNEVCENGLCVLGDDPNALWDLVVIGAEVSPTTIDGTAWDSFGGLPDPYAELSLGGLDAQTPSQQNTTAPTWGYTALVEVTTAALLADDLTLTLWDADLNFDDEIGSCAFPIDEDMLGQIAEFECTQGVFEAWSVVVFIPPA